MQTAPKVKIKYLEPRYADLEQFPRYGSSDAAGMDLRANITETLTVAPGETHLVPTGLAIYLEDPTLAGLILPRSGLGHKHGIILGNGTGLIDADYQGQLMVSVWNRSTTPYQIQPDERIAQYVVVPVLRPDFEAVEAFEISERGAGGFGSTGKA